MSKLPDLDAFDRGQIVGARHMGRSISKIVSQLGLSRSTMSRVNQENMDGGLKTSNWANCKRQIALIMHVRYIEFLEDHLRPFMLFCYPHYNGVFQQDNCTSHKFWLATGWLDELSCDFTVINLPPRSPDLNSIQHLWNVLEQGVKGYHTAPSNLTELWTALANIWQVIIVERFRKLV
ncbi:transposable element Tcb2 transposase [Trichonephila clavipes]|nr:transposable element Tcb2 transposase [Trichonephila clavipes]